MQIGREQGAKSETSRTPLQTAERNAGDRPRNIRQQTTAKAARGSNSPAQNQPEDKSDIPPAQKPNFERGETGPRTGLNPLVAQRRGSVLKNRTVRVQTPPRGQSLSGGDVTVAWLAYTQLAGVQIPPTGPAFEGGSRLTAGRHVANVEAPERHRYAAKPKQPKRRRSIDSDARPW